MDHYVDRYWNELPAVVRYLCRRATGDAGLWWMDHVKREFATPPRRRALVVACGNGWVERDLYDRGVALEFDAFDASPDYLRSAEAARGGRAIHYFQADFATFRPTRRYDLVVNVAAFHHARFLWRMMALVAAALEPDGLLVNWEYVGADRNQYAAGHVAIMEAVNAALPPRFRSPNPLRIDLATFLAGDPTEAVHASDIPLAFEDYFEVAWRRELAGGVAYPILWNNLTEFEKDDGAAREVLASLLRLDDELTDRRVVPPLFAYFIGRPRLRPRPLAMLRRLVREPVRERFADWSGGLYLRQYLARRTAEPPS